MEWQVTSVSQDCLICTFPHLSISIENELKYAWYASTIESKDLILTDVAKTHFTLAIYKSVNIHECDMALLNYILVDRVHGYDEFKRAMYHTM